MHVESSTVVQLVIGLTAEFVASGHILAAIGGPDLAPSRYFILHTFPQRHCYSFFLQKKETYSPRFDIAGLRKDRWTRIHMSSVQHIKLQEENSENDEWLFLRPNTKNPGFWGLTNPDSCLNFIFCYFFCLCIVRFSCYCLELVIPACDI